MIQQAFRIFGELELGSSFPEWTIQRHPASGEHLLTGKWQHDSLSSARQSAAAILGHLADDVEVLDLLTGIRESVVEAIARLNSPPSVATCFRFESLTYQGLRFLRLVGLAQFGEPDLLVEYEDDVRDEQVLELMGHLGHYRLTSERCVTPGEAIPFGYWLLSIASERIYPGFPRLPMADELAQGYQAALDAGLRIPPANFIIEAKDPARIGEDDWVVGASHALRVLEVQRVTHRRIAQICDVEVPFCEPAFSQDPVMMCSRVTSSEDFFGHRMALGPDGRTGWQFGCHDPDHIHDETTMAFGVLAQVCIIDYRLIQYIGLPPGWSVSREADGFWLNAPGDERSYRDEGSADHAPWCRVSHYE